MLGTFLGKFENPLNNKDIAIIELPSDIESVYPIYNNTPKTLGQIIKNNKEYRWRIRLYEDDIDTSESQTDYINYGFYKS